ncbi:MAG: DUF2723 domain-containing protein [Kiritimatiellae bacterium]|nr:DUF2723 domain-containing protein [Kiritimatiellia bacterium]
MTSPSRPRFLSRPDWLVAGIVAAISFAVYWATLAPTITMEYSGQLVVAAHHLGVGRPPGYPVWHLLAKFFTVLFARVTYHGQPNPAWAINFMSAVFGALACGTAALIISRVARSLFARPDECGLAAACGQVLRVGPDRRAGRSSALPPGAPSGRALPAIEEEDLHGNTFVDRVCAVSAFSGALLFAFSPTMWSQSVIADTHTLTNFYLLLYVALLLRWIHARMETSGALLPFSFGFGLCITPMFYLMAVPVLIAAGFVSRRVLLEWAVALAVFGGLILLEFFYGSRSPLAAGTLLGAVVAMAAAALVPRPTRRAAAMILLMLAGLLPVIYLPLAASHNAPMNMCCARTWRAFWYLVSRGQYERLTFANVFGDTHFLLHQVPWYLGLLAKQFTLPILCIAMVPVLSVPFRGKEARRFAILIFTAFFMFGPVALIGLNPKLDLQTTFIARVILIPSFVFAAILIGLGLAILLGGKQNLSLWKRSNMS